MPTRLIAAAVAAFGLLACSPEKDATSNLQFPVLSSPLAAVPSTVVASERPAAQSKEDAERRSN